MATSLFNALLKSSKGSSPLLMTKKEVVKAKVLEYLVSNSLELKIEVRKSFVVSPEFGNRLCNGS